MVAVVVGDAMVCGMVAVVRMVVSRVISSRNGIGAL